MNVGRTAPGIVFERLIQGLSKAHYVDVLTSDLDPSVELPSVKSTFEVKQRKVHPRIHKLLISTFGINPLDWLWSQKAISLLKKEKNKKYDLVFSFISFHHYSALLAGASYSQRESLKFAIYSVDAIPAPLGWSKNDSYFRQVKKMMRKYLSKADFFFSANEQMLKYQLTTFKPKSGMISGVVYNPNNGKLQNFNFLDNNQNTFLYTGGIYGPRKPQYVLWAFKRILKEYPNSTLEFVGSVFPESCLSIFTPEEKEKVVFHPFKRDLGKFYERAIALIDIDADLPNDVFLSSKMTNYIAINRLIISETGENSPSRQIFKGIPSVTQCGHDVDEIADAMRFAILKKDTISFEDRSGVISSFSLATVVEKLNSLIHVKS